MEATLLKSHKTFEGQTQFWEHDSVSTKTKMKFSTYIPTGLVKGCVIWLSGLTCTDENFITKAGAQKYLAEHQLMVICPDTSPRGLQLPGEHDSYDFGSGASFYVDAKTEGYSEHYNMFSYITNELYELIQNQFQIPKNKVSIMGHSMGGHGALVIGLRESSKFQSISAFAPITNPTLAPWGKKAFTGYLGEDQDIWKQYDATELIRSGARHPNEILIDQGLADEFYLKAQLLPSHFEKSCEVADQKLKMHYRADFDHSYYFIATFIESHIQHHAKFLA
ncbi:S-formylglutathione hydrolase [Bdellovibrio sp. HCB290]|uniref:S-formylglutathione hydrolase n=1 Tax=Bdellovibrio sp. HCB290 TaxID=3394356 RepID=UPI0039B4307E